jgi:ribosomal protein S27AE
MGASNELVLEESCPRCGAAPIVLQFTYGEAWQHRYRVGDVLALGRPAVDTPGRRRVLVQAEAEPCPSCGSDHAKPYASEVREDRLEKTSTPHAQRFPSTGALGSGGVTPG